VNNKVIFIDIDETIFDTPQGEVRDYTKSKPIIENVKKANQLYDEGHKIVYWTARGSRSGLDWYDLTKQQLNKFNVKYHSLRCDKPYYDMFIDDKGVNVEDWTKNLLNNERGVIAGAFDILHPGYFDALRRAKDRCNFLTVALQEDPTLERTDKLQPILSVKERTDALLSIKYVDHVVTYKTEDDLYRVLKTGNYDVRFLGDDYRHRNYTGSDLGIEIVYLPRDHGWSYTKIRQQIKGEE